MKPIIQKHGYDMIAGTTMYSENLIGIKLNTPVRKVEKPFFIGFAILDMSKHIIYDFFLLQRAQDDIRQRRVIGTKDTDSLIVQLSDKRATSSTKKICAICTSRLTFLNSITRATFFYGELVKYYEHEVDKSKLPLLELFLNFNKKLPGPIFKDEP